MLEVLGKDQFIDALPQEDMCLRIRQMRPSSLRGALEHALELESYQLASQQSTRSVREARLGVSESQAPQQSRGVNLAEKSGEELLQSMQECLKLLQQCAAGFTKHEGQRKKRYSPKPACRTPKEDVTCWRCHQKGHMKRDCKKRALGREESNASLPQNQGNDQ